MKNSFQIHIFIYESNISSSMSLIDKALIRFSISSFVKIVLCFSKDLSISS